MRIAPNTVRLNSRPLLGALEKFGERSSHNVSHGEADSLIVVTIRRERARMMLREGVMKPIVPAQSSAPVDASAAACLRARREAVKDRWLERLRTELKSARDQPDPVLIDDLPEMLDRLIEALEAKGSAKGMVDTFWRHSETRIAWTNYAAEDLMHEYVLLRKVLLALFEDAATPLTSTERDIVLDFIEEGMQTAALRFSELRRLHERLEMQYLKLIAQLVAKSGEPGGLDRLLEAIASELEAEAAAFLLYRNDTLELTLSAATAQVQSLAEPYRAALALAELQGPTANDNVVRLIDVRDVAHQAQEAFTKLEVRFLVGVKILSRGRLPGMLWIGFSRRRSVDPVEARLLEVLGDRLALLLASIELHEESKAALARASHQTVLLEAERRQLEEEKQKRDEVIAAISHDLKNPLSTARLGAELIRRGAPTPQSTQRLAEQILRSITRSDRMVHDLLDSHRLRAGKKLPLDIEAYSMNDLLAEVLRDLPTEHRERILVDAPAPVNGFWSWDGMRRVIENLLNNALKYAPPDSPIRVSVHAVDGKMELSVHNDGPPISPDEQSRIFLPFERGSLAPRSKKQGWGIGLTLVQGLVSAHGGAVSVTSTSAGGTVFKVANPMDSRPFQDDTE